MPTYYVNSNAQDTGDHEVHESTCSYLPSPQNQVYLGHFATCAGAVQAAKKTYPQSNGCLWCSPACHTG